MEGSPHRQAVLKVWPRACVHQNISGSFKNADSLARARLLKSGIAQSGAKEFEF